MNGSAAAKESWPRRRWWWLVGIVFTAQLALILGLSDRTPLKRRPPAKSPILTLAVNSSSEMLALLDPTLFALPHRQGFSAAAWKVSKPSELRSTPPPEPPEYLTLTIPPAGAGFDRFVASNRFEALPARRESSPAVDLPTLFSSPIATAPSSVRIQGGLAQRRLLHPLEVPPWPNSEILSNTVVQIAVDASGRTLSPGALLFSCGSREADEAALRLARAARFEPAAASAAPAFGRFIFEWQTIPMMTTNGTSSGPPP
jgi:TonB family protein